MATADATLHWPVHHQPTIQTAGRFWLKAEKFSFNYQTSTHAVHLHEYRGTIRIDGRSFPLEPGTLTVSPARVESSYDLPQPGMHWCIHFASRKSSAKSPSVQLPLARPMGELSGEAMRRMSRIARLHATRGPDAQVLTAAASVALQEFLVWIGLLDALGEGVESPGGDRIAKLMAFIDARLHLPLRAADLADHAGLSQHYLAGQFRKRVGMTLPRYVLSRRIVAARLLLETTDLPIKQIAGRVGLPDPHHFNKQFRLIAGHSPSDFRESRRQRRPIQRS